MTGGLHITAHALTRAMERIPGVTTEDQARAILTTHAISAMIAFGAKLIRLGTGHRLIIRDGRIITVTPAEHQSRNWLDRASRGEDT